MIEGLEHESTMDWREGAQSMTILKSVQESCRIGTRERGPWLWPGPGLRDPYYDHVKKGSGLLFPQGPELCLY